MSFRQPAHQFEMPAFVKTCFRPSRAERKARNRDLARRNLSYTKIREMEELMSLERTSFDQVKSAMRSRWEQVTDVEVQATLLILVGEGFLVPGEKKGYTLPSLPVDRTSLLFYGGWTRRDKSGVCPKCNKKVPNTNRHGNPHSLECIEFRINQVLES